MTAPPGKHPSDSLVEKTEIVLPSDANNLGTVFGGRVMEWIDIAAAISAGRHCRSMVVTASMDDLHFLAPIKAGHVALIQAQVCHAGRTSVEVGVTVQSEDPLTGERALCCRSWLTFVALDENRKPARVPPLIPTTPAEVRALEIAEERRELRLERKRKHEQYDKERQPS